MRFVQRPRRQLSENRHSFSTLARRRASTFPRLFDERSVCILRQRRLVGGRYLVPSSTTAGSPPLDAGGPQRDGDTGQPDHTDSDNAFVFIRQQQLCSSGDATRRILDDRERQSGIAWLWPPTASRYHRSITRFDGRSSPHFRLLLSRTPSVQFHLFS